MKFAAVLAFLFSLIAVGGVLYIVKNPPDATSAPIAKEESVYDRVMRTGVIRCGYADYPPFLSKDPNTGEMSGISVEIMNQLAQSLALKIEWTEEVSWGTLIEGLRDNRYDLFCTGVWANATRARSVDFTIPFVYTPLDAYVRSDDARFDNNLAAINQPDIRISTIDGEMGDMVARQKFPQATRVPVSQGAEFSGVLLNVAANKADVVFAEPTVAAAFLEHNAGALKNVSAAHPIDILPSCFPFRLGQGELKAMLDTALEQLINNGQVDEIIKKYETVPGAYFPVALPYRTAP
jgi:ABC-type amino acid transport substrate-binding protein